jgi:23S rRNA (uridine2552-2'-O)-methyltransferase
MAKELKTPKKFKSSSQLWLKRQINDPYVAKARKEGYRSRAAYKLLEMDDAIKCLKRGAIVVDLGAAPGSWAQVVLEKVGLKGMVIGIDLLPIAPMAGAEFIEGDFTEDKPLQQLEKLLYGKKVDVVLSDMAANTTGHNQTDHLRIMNLCSLAFEFSKDHLKEGGSFICKVFAGGTESQLLSEIKKSFSSVKHIKPSASRKESAEIYLVAKGFKG